MDQQNLVQILQGSIHPDTREEAEKQLGEVHKIIHFSPTLLRVVMDEGILFPVRQAGVIYLKNMVNQFWNLREPDSPLEPIPFSIHEDDKVVVRSNIIQAIIVTPDLIRVQLAVCLSTILRHDYPGRWDSILDTMYNFLSVDDPSTLYGALIAVHQLVKNYEYKKPDEREPLHLAMIRLLPLVQHRCVQLLPDVSDQSLLMQKQILKIVYAMIQYNLPLDLVNRDIFKFGEWMQIIQTIVSRPIPESTLQVDIDDRPELPCWKVKKWAIHFLSRVFERYGSPGSVIKDYVKFSDWYLKTFSATTLKVLLGILEQYSQKVYIAPRVTQLTLSYINTGVSHAFSWTFIKPHIQPIIQEVLFPLMCYTDEDDELWNEDPYEYIRIKFDAFEDFISPVAAAQTVLRSCAKKRKQVLQKAMGFCMQIMTTPGVEARKKDGVMHMVGTIADILLKKKMYKDRMEQVLVTNIFPEFNSELGHMRARANYVLHQFCEAKFKNERNLMTALDLTRNSLIHDKEMPVKVEAAIALQELITSHEEKAKHYVQPYIKDILEALLYVIRKTENDDLTEVMQRLITTYGDDIIPIAIDITQHLATTFSQVIDSEESVDDRAATAMGILNTIETILNVVEEKQEIVLQLEGIVLNVVAVVLQNNVLDFYEEVMSLIFSMTCTHISPPLWQVFEMLYSTFETDGYDYFVEMMPALHNYVTTDPPAFLSNSRHLEIVYNMCKKVLEEEPGDDQESHAAKLLEVLLLQYKGEIDQCVPLFIEVVMTRLTKEVKTTELRQMCLQVVVAALYYNPRLLMETLEKMTIPNTNEAVTTQFIKQWLHDTDCFLGLHDRKMCVLGICTLLSLPNLPPVVMECSQQFIPALLLLFRGLKRAYESRVLVEEEESDEEDDDSDYEEQVLDSDEDDIDEEGAEYLEHLEKLAQGRENEDEDEDEMYEETVLEGFNTPLDDEDGPFDDEYMLFKTVLTNIQANSPSWYSALTSHLNLEQQNDMEEIAKMADQRKAAADSRQIEKQGGYKFQAPSVPKSFNFGSMS
ncbi:importin-7-like [Acanthaster planci]|uniref:Importin-7-like n=1 Tax=Acanthaster planci TaxID=133434 RepID=A0A8B7Y7J4_ACAPL|nr:importin-7-like [Acanthaster planci]